MRPKGYILMHHVCSQWEVGRVELTDDSPFGVHTNMLASRRHGMDRMVTLSEVLRSLPNFPFFLLAGSILGLATLLILGIPTIRKRYNNNSSR